MFGIKENDEIPYADQAGKLFNHDAGQLNAGGKQLIIPFLGAGVSISSRKPNQPPVAKNLEPDKLGSIFQQLGLNDQTKVFQEILELTCRQLEGRTKAFMEIAVLLACMMQEKEKQLAATNQDVLSELRKGAYPPSAGELASLFSQLANYTTFNSTIRQLRKNFPGYTFTADEKEQIEALRLLAKVTGIANPPDMLTSITSYYESISGRQSLWNNLSSVIALKKETTPTHKLIARAAKYHLSQKRALDYLIITTNYDCLMEEALDELDVPYAVLLTRKSDQKVVVRFSEKVSDYDWLNDLNKGGNDGNFANGFVLQKGDLRNVVVIYKIHGCLYQKLKLEEADGIIISDNDYVNYIKQMGKGNSLIPAYVNTLMNNKPFLFLGYSLNDWNIRSIFETMREKRSPSGGVQDFSVMKDIGEYEKVFFQRNEILIFKTDLNSFVGGILNNLPDDVKGYL